MIKISVSGLLGYDILQFIKELKVVDCINGSALELTSGVMPYGNIDNFLHPEQFSNFKHRLINNYSTIASKATCSSKIVNAVLEPKHSYEDCTAVFFDESAVERGVERMLSLESLGIHESDNISHYDQIQIDKFAQNIK